MIFNLMHFPHNTPPNGLSGLFFVFARFLILWGRSLGTPFRAAPQFEHFAILCFFFLYCRLVLPPGTFLKILLRLVDLNLGAGILFWKEYLFIKVIVDWCYQKVKGCHLYLRASFYFILASKRNCVTCERVRNELTRISLK